MISPVTPLDRSLQRYSAVLATSSCVMVRPMGDRSACTRFMSRYRLITLDDNVSSGPAEMAVGLCLGADSLMMGNFFARYTEGAGNMVRNQVQRDPGTTTTSSRSTRCPSLAGTRWYAGNDDHVALARR